MISYTNIKTDSSEYQAERELRNEILLRPIGLPDFAWEMCDKKADHIVALLDGGVVGCAVLCPTEANQGVAQLMQMAVRKDLQGHGIGTGLVKFLINFARQKNLTEVTCHARQEAVSFYERLGFEIYGTPFEEAGISHRHMRYSLLTN
ncbi:GNAT family N-acetyltransferase [candidate division KSB1 bacterium]|nr:GNAT family N-acetyltransferase [candidate division KSB1 bacterium]